MSRSGEKAIDKTRKPPPSDIFSKSNMPTGINQDSSNDSDDRSYSKNLQGLQLVLRLLLDRRELQQRYQLFEGCLVELHLFLLEVAVRQDQHDIYA